ncbi:MAG: HAMP domain-containing protein [Deltaproteobacteria bacterium]|nr:MAG: HAMP domain-containing protein [Deltaproteobacteria bacterium]
MLKRLRIPIFVKFSILATLAILSIVSTISTSILKRQRVQFTDQLIDFGATMSRYAASNSPERLLEEAELPLYQLVSDIAKNNAVVYALIVNSKGITQAHSNISLVGNEYEPPADTVPVQEEDGLQVQGYQHAGEDFLLFSTPILYQDMKIGEVRLGLTTKYIEANLFKAKVFVWMLTLAITVAGIAMSMMLSFYFSRPIQRLGTAVEEIGKGNFNYKVHLARNDELGDLGEAINRMAEDLRLKQRIQTSFGRYVTPEIVERILASPDNDWMKGTSLEATILFVDIRGFTALAERSLPETVVELLNEYFSLVTDIIIQHGGYLDKFVGDAVMGVFGALIPDPAHAQSAVRAAVEVRRHLPELNRRLTRVRDPIQVGIGINTGEVVAGNLGSSKRMEYTVVGDNVNVASRLTDLAGANEILISEQTFLRVLADSRLSFQSQGEIEIKGRQEPVKIYEVMEQGSHREAWA